MLIHQKQCSIFKGLDVCNSVAGVLGEEEVREVGWSLLGSDVESPGW